MQVLSTNIAAAREMTINDREVLTGILKRSVSGPIEARPLGLAGDEQADLSVHGGLGKAIYAYPVEHYPFWQTVRAQAKVATWNELLPHGFMGENLTIRGLLESEVCIGDVLRFANCELAVSEPRFPCFKFNAVMGFNQAAKLMVANAWCGFYLAVRTPGTVEAGETFELIHGPREVSITALFRSQLASQKN
ncbi:MAG: sulfurase [Burkholderiales bacterium PBB1]|nr:MAG: sulfurase [Burkholderiales bacterium PBB1]